MEGEGLWVRVGGDLVEGEGLEGAAGLGGSKCRFERDAGASIFCREEGESSGVVD